MIGIIGAMDVEVENIINEMENVSVTNKASMKFFKGSFCGKDVVVVKSGIGKVNAAVCAQILCDNFEVDAIINTGIAGSLENDIDIGDIVLSKDTVEHDMDAGFFGYEYGQVPGMDVHYFCADAKMIERAQKACETACPDVSIFTGRVVSGDKFVNDRETKNWLKTTFNALCTEMEGAAIGHVAHLNSVPYIVVRAISDKADETAVMDYTEFESQAIKNLVNMMRDFVKSFD